MKSHYNPDQRKIVLHPNASLYARFHELAHADQHEKMVPAFAAWTIFYRVRVLNYFATLWVEFDANRRAKRVMKVLGIWDDGAAREARKNLMSYVARRSDPVFRAKEKMIRPHAQLHVACVTDVDADRNVSPGDSPGNAMNSALAQQRSPYSAISIVPGARPQPAPVFNFSDFRPELGNSLGREHLMTVTGNHI